LLSGQRNVPISAEIKGSSCALGGPTLRKKVKIGFLAPSAFVEGIERRAKRQKLVHRGFLHLWKAAGPAVLTAAINREE
jgi:hypothetical protein